jgi:hypothetical protein
MGDIVIVNCDGTDPAAASPAERTAWITAVLNHPGNTLTAEQLVGMSDDALRGCATLARAHGDPVANSGSGGFLPPPDLMAELARDRR